jgi:hypothetical protein
VTWLATFLAALLEPIIQKAINNALSEWKVYMAAQWKDDLLVVQKQLDGPLTAQEKLDAASKLAALIARLG